LNGAKISNENIYQYLERQHIKMSIVLFQNSLALGYATNSTFGNQDVTDSELDVSEGVVTTDAGDERIFEVDFGTKSQYKLFNYTAGNAEMGPYGAVTRTAPRAGFAGNSIFAVQVAFLKYVPLVVAYLDPQLYQEAKNHVLNMTYADCFYVISYPEYYGFTIEHDPTFIAYVAAATPPVNPSGPSYPLGFVIVGAAVAVAVVIVLKRRASS
jgi:hypothetical protein